LAAIAGAEMAIIGTPLIMEASHRSKSSIPVRASWVQAAIQLPHPIHRSALTVVETLLGIDPDHFRKLRHFSGSTRITSARPFMVYLPS